MQYIASLREQAAYYHEIAAKWRKGNKPEEAAEYEDLAETCEEVAAEIEDHVPAG
jgi:predicted transposase YbfD/YdcC